MEFPDPVLVFWSFPELYTTMAIQDGHRQSIMAGYTRILRGENHPGTGSPRERGQQLCQPDDQLDAVASVDGYGDSR